MKSKFFLTFLVLISLGLASLFVSCGDPDPQPSLSAILKDLKPETYLLDFGASDGKIFDKPQYGSLTEWTNIPAKSVGFNIPGYDRIPLYKLVWPTCPAYGLDELLAKRIVTLASKTKLKGAEELSVINIDGRALIASQSSLKTLSGYVPDGLDSIGMQGVVLSDVAICPDPVITKIFGARRPVYGIPQPSYAEIMKTIQIRPGCKDPRSLRLILENFQRFDKAAFSNYRIREIGAQTAVLESF
jgi:hypothetical protein